MCATAYYRLINWILMFHGPLICERPQQYNMIMEMPILYTILSAVVIIDFECQSKRFKSHSTLTNDETESTTENYLLLWNSLLLDRHRQQNHLTEWRWCTCDKHRRDNRWVCGIRTGATYLIQLPPNLNRRDYRIIPLPYDQIYRYDRYPSEWNK